MVFPVPPPDDLSQPSPQPAAPANPLKPATASQNPSEEQGPNQGQELPQTSVADTPSGGPGLFLPKMGGRGRRLEGRQKPLEKVVDKGKSLCSIAVVS